MPVNPLLSVTPMSSDKKRLRERIARIAEDRKTKKLALCAMSLLTAAVCVFTFAGCVEQAGRAAVPPSVPDAAPAAPSELDAPSAVDETEEGLLAAIPRSMTGTNYQHIQSYASCHIRQRYSMSGPAH